MTLIVEDGTGLANAESYCSVAEAGAYHASRGKADDWDAIDDKEAALRIATDYISQTRAGSWSGARATTTQVLDWPRSGVAWRDSPTGVRASNAIPRELKFACAELALRTADGPLLEDLEREVISETVDVISTTYAQGSPRQKKFSAAEGWLQQLMGSSSSSIRVVRA